jgi:hypothetical protein
MNIDAERKAARNAMCEIDESQEWARDEQDRFLDGWLARARLDGGWSPIESAPLDGTVVLIYSPMEGVMSSRWEYQWQGFPWRCAQDRKRQIPTHWMPLPEPPHDRPR